MSDNKWEYGGAYKRHDMRGNIALAGGIVKVHNIFDETPDFMRAADCIFCDPPCSLGNLKSFYTKADIDGAHLEYHRFADRLFSVIDEIAPKHLFLEVFKSNRDDFLERVKARFEYVHIYATTYYHKANCKCWIIAASQEPIDCAWIEGMDEEDVIYAIAERVPFACIGDPCIGRGLVGLAAIKQKKLFVGTELNEKRLAVLLDRIA